MTPIIPSLFALEGQAAGEVEAHSFYQSLEQLADGRKARGKQYPLAFVLTLICLAKLAGETTISGVVDWTRNRAEFLREQLHWTRGFPTNSTYTYALARTDAEQVVQIVAQVLVRAHAQQEGSQGVAEISQVAMDGKAMRGTWSQAQKEREQQRVEAKKQEKQEPTAKPKPTRQKKGERPAEAPMPQAEEEETEGHPRVHLLSLYECHSGIVLAQRSVGRKTNEISAAAALMHPALVKDRLLSADALHTQTKWCAAVTAFGGDYLLFAKGNQPTLFQDLHDFFADPEPERDEWRHARQVSKGHGRLEIRQIWTSTQMNDWFEPQWAGIQQVFCVHRQVSSQGKTREETVYGFTSLSRQRANADRLLAHIQAHWTVENRLHWRRDVSLGEDACQVRSAGAPQTLAALNGALLGLMDYLGVRNVPKQMRYFDAHPSAMISLLCHRLSR